MSELKAFKISSKNEDAKPLGEDIRAEKTEQLREKIVSDRKKKLGSLSITTQHSQDIEEPSGVEEEPVLMLSAANESVAITKPSIFSQFVTISASVLTLGWIGFCVVYAIQFGLVLSPSSLGAFAAGVFAPPALLWLFVTHLNRKSDVQLYASSLRNELQSLLFPSKETASVMNKDIERLCAQAAEISAATKATLKSLQRARQGLRVEIRDFSGVSKKAEFHIDRLAESLNERATKLKVLTDEIEERTNKIDERTQAGAEAWDEATLLVLERSSEMEAALEKGAQKLLDAADAASGKTEGIEAALQVSTDNLHETIEGVAERLGDLTTRFDGQKEGLRDVADEVAKEIDYLSETIRNQVDGLDGVVDRTVETITHAVENIQGERSSLDVAAQDLAAQSSKIADILSGSVTELENSVGSVEERAVSMAQQIEDKTEALQNAVTSISDQANGIEEAGQHASNQLGEALSLAVSGAESIR